MHTPVHTWCTPGPHLVNSGHMVHTQIMNTLCTPGAHLVHTWWTAILMHSWCTLGSQLVNSLPFNHPSTLLPSYQSLYLFYLYHHIYVSIHSISISTSITLSILSLCTRCAPDVQCYITKLPVHLTVRQYLGQSSHENSCHLCLKRWYESIWQ